MAHFCPDGFQHRPPSGAVFVRIVLPAYPTIVRGPGKYRSRYDFSDRRISAVPISPGHPVTDVSRESCGYLLDIEPLTGRARAQDIHRIYGDMVSGITALGQWIGRPRSSIRHRHQVMWPKKGSHWAALKLLYIQHHTKHAKSRATYCKLPSIHNYTAHCKHRYYPNGAILNN